MHCGALFNVAFIVYGANVISWALMEDESVLGFCSLAMLIVHVILFLLPRTVVACLLYPLMAWF